jgi:hypothetical protein
MTVADDVLDEVHRESGLTAVEITIRVYGRRANLQTVNKNCRDLVEAGLLKRRGKGRAGHPFTYHLPFKKRRQ